MKFNYTKHKDLTRLVRFQRQSEHNGIGLKLRLKRTKNYYLNTSDGIRTLCNVE